MGVGILIPAEKTTRGPHKILVLLGLKDIKILTF